MGGILDMGKIEMTDEYVRVGTTLYKIVFNLLLMVHLPSVESLGVWGLYVMIMGKTS